MLKTHYCGELNLKLKGKEVVLAGWVHSRRDHGKVIFIDLRDSTGLAQLVITPTPRFERGSECRHPQDRRSSAGREAVPTVSSGRSVTSKIKEGQKLNPEFVIQVKGKVNERPAGMKNKKIATGEIEVEAIELKILSKSKTPPFELDQDTIKVNEEKRLEYRYLDLRTERMAKNLKTRFELIQFIRNYLQDRGFTEIQTPILSKSTPEGARDYLVPSRLHQGKFFALPQSPQQYKQLLMVAGVERYFQIAPCFRDEDARADRSPGEFYQIDIEMSFVEREDVLKLTEEMFSQMIKKIFPKKKINQIPWPRITHQETIKKYKSDKPDLRQDKKDKDELAFAWIIDFPLFTKQTKEDFFHGAGNKLAPSHHMFTAPREEDVKYLETDPSKVKSYQYDLVLNGFEVGGGSIRIHDPKIQEKIFNLIGFDKKDKKMFSHILRAFEYGVPPHGGIAPGLDRLLMILENEPNIREVIAFPKTGDGRDPMMDTPSEVKEEQLKELGIKIDLKKK
ncbi:aspartate--tRNA ligase [Patescibacteria group bacterium]|nr:aspartate--tRNA ligase [Patescibacteria group bacterium]